MTSAIATRVIPGDFRTATRATGERCTGVGRAPVGNFSRWDDRATCPGCLLSQRKTQDDRMGSHYVTPTATGARVHGVPATSNELTVPLPAPMSSVTAVSSRFEEVIAHLDTPTEPGTVGEFVRAIIALSGALAAAQARITELEQAPQSPPPAAPAPAPSPVNPDEVAQWQADWLELNYLLAHYAVDRGWCSEFEDIIRDWNRTHFQRGYLLTRHNIGARHDIRLERQSNDQRRINSSTLSARRTAAKERHQASR